MKCFHTIIIIIFKSKLRTIHAREKNTREITQILQLEADSSLVLLSYPSPWPQKLERVSTSVPPLGEHQLWHGAHHQSIPALPWAGSPAFFRLYSSKMLWLQIQEGVEWMLCVLKLVSPPAWVPAKGILTAGYSQSNLSLGRGSVRVPCYLAICFQNQDCLIPLSSELFPWICFNAVFKLKAGECRKACTGYLFLYVPRLGMPSPHGRSSV